MSNSYPKSGNATGKSKEINSKSLEMTRASKSGDGSGPTGSARTYPKGSKPSMSADFNPQKVKATDWVVGGC